MIALLAALVSGQLDPLAKLPELQVIGWSADATRFAVRAIDRANEADHALPQECPGYKDLAGKRLHGRVIVAAYERGALQQSWLVQDWPKCTTPDAAKKVLEAATAELSKLGIDLHAAGKHQACVPGCDLGHGGAKLELENDTNAARSADRTDGVLLGALHGWLKAGKSRTLVFERNVNETWSLANDARMKAEFLPVELAPKGAAVVVRAAFRYESARGSTATVVTLGVFSWKDGALERQ